MKFINEIIYRLNVGKSLDLRYLEQAFVELLNAENSDVRNVQLGALLTGLMAKGPSVEELEVIFKALFSKDNFSPNNSNKERIDLPEGECLIGAVGSGKKGIKTVNISTASMLVAATLGVYTAKPGSSSVSSITGSSDVLSEMGVNVHLSLHKMKRVVQETHFGIFKIENYLKTFGEMYNGKLHAPHVLSYGLAALANVVHVDKLLYGFTHPDIKTSVKLLKRFGFDNCMVACCTHDGIHYIDELGVFGDNRIIGIKDGVLGAERKFQPTELLSLPPYSIGHIKQGRNVFENVKLVVDVLAGKGRDALTDIIAINTSALLYLNEDVKSFKDGYKVAKECIKSGKPIDKVKDVVEATEGDINKLMKYLS